MKDYTFAHCVNVCVYALDCGTECGFDNQKLNDLAVGAILHDIGKSLLPNQILDFSKIVSLADVYDALTSDRVYRKRSPSTPIIGIINNNQLSNKEIEVNDHSLYIKNIL